MKVGVGAPLLRLPEALRDWRIERELASRGAEADILLVANAAGERRVAKVYRAGIEPKTDVLERVGGSSFEHVVHLFDHGQSDGRWYELLEYVEHGSLEDLLHREGLRLEEPRIREVLFELTGAIEHLHDCDVVHRDIKPSNILVRSLEPLDLVLADFGIASVLGDASKRFTNMNRTIAYAAPETAAGEVSRAADWWSLGMILVEILTGRHPFAGLDDRVAMSRLFQMPVDQLVEGVGEPWGSADGKRQGERSGAAWSWRLLCRGLLRREAKNRWGHDEIAAWLGGDKTLAVTEEAAPSIGGHAPFFFAGQRYGSLNEIANAFGANWQEARKAVGRGHLLNWVKDDLKDNEWRQFLSDLDRDCEDLDERVFRILLKADPAATPVFCGHRLDPEGLRALAETALANKEKQAQETLAELWKRPILHLATETTGVPQYQELEERWKRSLAEYRNVRTAVAQAGGPEADSDLPLAEMLLAVLPNGDAYVAQLREKAAQAITPVALECEWFGEFAGQADTSITAMLLAPLFADTAEREVRDARRRAQEESERRQRQQAEEERQRQYQTAYTTWRTASGISVGVLAGIAVGFIPCWIISGIAGWAGGVETGWNWFGILMLLSAAAGAVVGHQANWRWIQNWLQAPSSPDGVCGRGLAITLSPLAIMAFLGIYWITSAGNEVAAERGRIAREHQAVLEQQERERQQEQAVEQERRALIGTFDVYEKGFDHKNDRLKITTKRDCFSDNVANTRASRNGQLYSFLIRIREGDNMYYYPYERGYLSPNLNGRLRAFFFDAAGSNCSSALARLVNAGLVDRWFVRDLETPARWESAPTSSVDQ